MTQTLGSAQRGTALLLTLQRPERRNALDLALMAALTQALERLPNTTRAVVLQGAGPAFCAGADVRGITDVSAQAPFARALDALFAAVAQAPVPVVAVAHGPVRGGGVGLLCAADVVLACEDTTLAFPEAALGLVPATIAPYVLARVGEGTTRHLFLTGQVIDAPAMQRLGFAHQVVADSEREAALSELLRALGRQGPEALAHTKKFLQALRGQPLTAQRAMGLEMLAQVQAGAEAQAGRAAYLAKRPAPWVQP